MGISAINQSVTMLLNLFNAKKRTVPVLQEPSFKSPCTIRPVTRPLERATPESQGVCSLHVARFVQELQKDRSLNMHSLLLLRNGKVIAETVFGVQDVCVPKMTFSACKSVTALAVGMLIDEGKLSLSTKVVDVFPDKVTPVTRLRYKELTVEHLLTMTSGAAFNEGDTAVCEDWIKGFFGSIAISRPGKEFFYNSLNSYLLTAIVCRISGESLIEYLRPRLFEPLGITDVQWETCPHGIEKGGWGLYIRNEDLAKIGQLVLQNGYWNGEQLVSAWWIQQAIAARCAAPPSYGDFDYGYHFWSGRKQPSFLMNGMFGQNVLAFPNTNILLVTNAGNDEMFQQSRYFDLAQDYFGGEFEPSLPEQPDHLEQLNETLAACGWKPTVEEKPPLWKRVFRFGQEKSNKVVAWHGVRLTPTSSNAPSVGLFPVLLQITQNNFASGLVSIAFLYENERLWMHYVETDVTYRLAVGFHQETVDELVVHGIPYRVAVRGRFAVNEDGDEVLTVTVDFLETPCTRILKFVRHTDADVTLYQSETPGQPFVLQLTDLIKERLEAFPLLGSAAEKLDDDYIEYKIERLLEPKVIMIKNDD